LRAGEFVIYKLSYTMDKWKTTDDEIPSYPFSSGPSKRKPTSAAKEVDRSKKSNITKPEKALDQGQKVDKIFEMLTELQPIIKKLEDLGVIKEIEDKVERLDGELEKVKRELIASNVVIMGVLEKKEESHEQLEQQVEKVFGSLDIGDVDYGRIRRLGLPKEGKSRIIQVKLVRESDKVKILKANNTLKGKKDFAEVYINSEQTQLQEQHEKKLRKTAKFWKDANKNLKYHIRGNRLIVTDDKDTNKFKVNEGGQVEPVKKVK